MAADGRAFQRVDPARRLEVLREQIGDDLALRRPESRGRAVEALRFDARQPYEERGTIGC